MGSRTPADILMGCARDRRSAGEFVFRSWIVLGLSVLSILSWLCYFIVTRIDYTMELTRLLPVTLESVSSADGLLKGRSHSLSLILKKRGRRELGVLFDSGKAFKLPDDSLAFKNYIEHRAQQIVVMGMLQMRVTPGASRVQIWSEKGLQTSELNRVVGMLAGVGFDSFDFAVDVEAPEGHDGG